MLLRDSLSDAFTELCRFRAGLNPLERLLVVGPVSGLSLSLLTSANFRPQDGRMKGSKQNEINPMSSRTIIKNKIKVILLILIINRKLKPIQFTPYHLLGRNDA